MIERDRDESWHKVVEHLGPSGSTEYAAGDSIGRSSLHLPLTGTISFTKLFDISKREREANGAPPAAARTST